MVNDDDLPVHRCADQTRHLSNVSALQRFQILDTAPESAFDHIVEIASRIFSVPIVLVSLIDLNRQWFKARVGLEACETNLDVSFCAYAVNQDDVMVVYDATKDERFADNELVTAPGGIRFYAGAPLRTSDGFVVGTLCLVDTVVHHEFVAEDRVLLSKMASLVVDVMEGRASQRTSAEAKKKLEDFTSAALDVFWETDTSHRFTHFASQKLTGLHQSLDQENDEVDAAMKRMIGRTRWEMLDADVRSEPWRSHIQTLDARLPFRDMRYSTEVGGKTLHLSTSGRPVFDEQGAFVGYRGATHDVTQQEEARLEALKLANSDPLTGLANRRCWNAALESRLAPEVVPPTGVLLFDVDRFKDINDAMGHAVGDSLLVEIAKRIVNCASQAWLAARLGGDEFALLVDGGYQDSIRAADCIVKAMEHPFEIGGHNLHVELSIGIRVLGAEKHDGERTMVDADLALRLAKKRGRHRHVTYDPSMRVENDHRIVLMGEFERALQNDEFKLYYQPQLRLSNDVVVGMEGLLRWDHPERGLLSPEHFLNALETSAFDISVGRRVIDLACRQASLWRDLGTPVRVGINVSASQLYGDNLPKVLKEAMQRHQTTASLIEVEVTERVALGNSEKIQAVLEAINAMGVTIAFDDFGTGFASLCSLMQFPLDRVKIDRRFVMDLAVNPSNARLTSGLVRLCHSLGFEVIAEGVEAPEHETFLREQNCDEVQGFFYSRPLCASEATDFLVERASPSGRSKLTG
ncbi:sensor domain-containing phosphodiesterase [Roseobacter weihaiensis]|uniref:sensor domain-containing phosphodiesterase n=1 Tax=Roseobacter weihaiensis TaxID=2763262 RepID=UPI001D0B17E6|nr:EAL domain-containing protein [Roseobacter sp. H9]